MTRNSLAFRLFASAAVWVVVALGIAGFALVTVHAATTERAFDERLHAYLKTLVADLATRDPGAPEAIGALGEPNFELPLKGWYWRIEHIGEAGGARFASASLFGATLAKLPVPDGNPGALRTGYIDGPGGERLRMAERTIDLGLDGRFDVAVTAPAAEIEADLRRFRRSLVLAFAAVGAGLIGATLAQVRYGLAPLRRMSAALRALRAGEIQAMPAALPDEIAPLARELDALVEANRETIERARTHAGNLAHALKTPLAVIANEAEGPAPSGARLVEQVAVMRRQIDYHLQRARIAAAVDVVGTVTPVREVVEALTRTLRKIRRDVAIEVVIEGEPQFRGERQDLEEMVGNLLENACKWSGGEVRLTVGTAVGAARPTLRFTVEDDGPGVPADRRADLGRRGKRLDETVPGTGLGLSIVGDLAGLYGGALRFDEAETGGLKVELDLPGA